MPIFNGFATARRERERWLLTSTVGGAIASLLVGCGPAPIPLVKNELIASEPDFLAVPTYQTETYSKAVVHWVTVPAGGAMVISVGMEDALAPLTVQAVQVGAIAAINAGFFDPQNGLTTSYIMQDGAVVAAPGDNPRLMENPALATYLDAILNRSEFRIYNCDGAVQYDITPHLAPLAAHCNLRDAVGAGPQLLPVMTGHTEGFMADNAQGERVRDTLGSSEPNARSAVGIKADGTVVLAISTQLPDTTTASGFTLTEMAAFMKKQGVEKALNLDGGSSTGLYFEGQTYFGRWEAGNPPSERPIKSILYVSADHSTRD
jgi:hypothetical protein